MAYAFFCPIISNGRICDRPGFYLLNGASLCRIHARECEATVAELEMPPAAVTVTNPAGSLRNTEGRP